VDKRSDPTRTLRLLWRDTVRPPRQRGPKPGIDVGQIVAAGIEIADAEGIAALGMRRVAERLGIGTMSLYTYVAGKGDLVDAMIDASYAEAVPRDGTVPRDDASGASSGSAAKLSTQVRGWRQRLERVARENWQLFQHHPWLLDVPRTRSLVGPNTIAKYESELAAIDGIGLTDGEMDAVLNLVITHAEGAARRSFEATRTERESGMTDLEWWEQVGPLLYELTDAESYPTASRVGAAVGAAHQAASAPAHDFEFGLRRVLDGVAQLVIARNDA
jgi:AcrR family transcriptional regulator